MKKILFVITFALTAWEEVKVRLNSFASRLSFGQQQRLCLARGLAVEHEIIPGAEPRSALDPVSTQRIEELFLQFKYKYSMVLVTHILRQARRVSDYIVFIYMSEIIEFGSTENVLIHPKEKLTQDSVKGFISRPLLSTILLGNLPGNT